MQQCLPASLLSLWACTMHCLVNGEQSSRCLFTKAKLRLWLNMTGFGLHELCLRRWW